MWFCIWVESVLFSAGCLMSGAQHIEPPLELCVWPGAEWGTEYIRARKTRPRSHTHPFSNFWVRLNGCLLTKFGHYMNQHRNIVKSLYIPEMLNLWPFLIEKNWHFTVSRNKCVCIKAKKICLEHYSCNCWWRFYMSISSNDMIEYTHTSDLVTWYAKQALLEIFYKVSETPCFWQLQVTELSKRIS